MKGARLSETKFNEHFSQGYFNTENIGGEYSSKPFERVVVVGIGGSALSGILLKSLLEDIDSEIDVIVHRNYSLPPKSLLKNALIMLISYSGETEEVLDAYNEAINNNLPSVVITSGGKLKEKADANNIPYFLLPGGSKPRFSIIYQIGAILSILENVGIINSQEHIVNTIQENDHSKIEQESNKVISHIQEDTPIIYASPKYYPLAYIIKIQINENANHHAFSNIFPEANHNEIMGYTSKNSNQYSPIILRSDDDDQRVIHQQNDFINILQSNENKVCSVDITGNTKYNTLFNGILLGHLVSFDLAEKKNVDPLETAAITDCKNRARKRAIKNNLYG